MPESTGIIRVILAKDLTTFQTQVGRLQAALAKTEEGEEQLKVKVQGLSKNVSTKEVMTQDLQVIRAFDVHHLNYNLGQSIKTPKGCHRF